MGRNTHPEQDPVEGSREVVEKQLERAESGEAEQGQAGTPPPGPRTGQDDRKDPGAARSRH